MKFAFELEMFLFAIFIIIVFISGMVVNNHLFGDDPIPVQDIIIEPTPVIIGSAPITVNNNQGIDEIDFILESAKRFSSQREYVSSYDNSSEQYNCGNYSNDFASYMLEAFGINVAMVSGWPENNSMGHMWNRVFLDIEPQRGELVDYSEKYPANRKERWIE